MKALYMITILLVTALLIYGLFFYSRQMIKPAISLNGKWHLIARETAEGFRAIDEESYFIINGFSIKGTGEFSHINGIFFYVDPYTIKVQNDLGNTFNIGLSEYYWIIDGIFYRVSLIK